MAGPPTSGDATPAPPPAPRGPPTAGDSGSAPPAATQPTQPSAPSQPTQTIPPPQPAVDLSSMNGQTVYLTDALRNGIMLRDNRLTLRHNSAFTPFIIEASSQSGEYVLKCPVAEGRYIQTGGKNAFRVDQTNANSAQKFRLVSTDLGVELRVVPGNNEKSTYSDRPSVFDDFYDVSVGKWSNGRSYIPILVRTDMKNLSLVWY